MNNNAGKVHQIPFNLDLNTASLEELQKLPMVGSRERALAIINARPLTSWAQVVHIEGFDISMAEDLRRGGASLGRRAA